MPSRKLFLIFLFCFLLLIVFSYLFLFKSKDVLVKQSEVVYSLKLATVPDQISKIFINGYKIGAIDLTLSDLEKEFKLMFEYTPENTSDIKKWNDAILNLNNKAIIQNEGLKVGLFTQTVLDPAKVNQARDYINKVGKIYVSGEFISIWFLNVNEPSIGVPSAKKIALDKINLLRQRIISKEITPKQAGEEIRNDSSLALIDNAYQSNAYRKFESIGINQPIFTDTLINKRMWELNVGETSEVLTARDFSKDGPYDAYFIVITLNDKNNSGYNSLDDLIKMRKTEGLEIKL